MENKYKQITNKAKKASKVQGAAIIVAKAISLIFSVLLARILMPEDYGYLTVALVFTNFLTIFSTSGFQTFLIQNTSEKTTSEKYLHTVFFVDFGFSVLVGLLLVLVGWIYTLLGGDPVINQMIQLYAMHVILIGIKRSPLAEQKRLMQFNLVAIADFLFILLSNGFKLLFAILGYASLSFPLGDIAGELIVVLFVLFGTGFFPSVKKFVREAAREVIWFGKQVVVASIATYFANQTDKLLLSISFPNNLIGLYGFAQTQPNSVYNLLIKAQAPVFLSFYSKMKDDRIAVKRFCLKVTRILNFVLMPLFLFGIIEGELIIRAVFGEKWLPATLLFQMFCLINLIRCFFSSITGLQLALGYPKEAKRLKIINSIIIVICILIGSLFQDLNIFAVSFAIASLIVAFINVHVNGKLVNLSIFDFIKNTFSNISLALITLFLYLAITFAVTDLQVQMAFDLILRIALFFSLYGILAFVFNKKMIAMLREFIFQRKIPKLDTP